MRSVANTGARCKPSRLLTALCALWGLAACGGGDDDGGNPFLRPYIRPDSGVIESDMRPDLSSFDPFAEGRTPCEREGESCVLPGGTGTCVSNTCRLIACIEGSGDCDGDPNNGCEVDLTLAESCGSCVAQCSEDQICQKGSTGYTCAVGVLCPQGSFDLDAQSANGCEWSESLASSTRPQPEGRFAIVQRVALVGDDDFSEYWTGAVTGFDALGNRAVLMAEQDDLQTVAELDEPFSGVSLALDALSQPGMFSAFDVWQDAAYLSTFDEGTSEFDSLAFTLQCAPRSSDDQAVSQAMRGGNLSTTWTAELTTEHMFLPLDVCELPPEDDSPPERELCVDEARAFGPADYFRWFYPYESNDPLDNPGAHAPEGFRLSVDELATCTQCGIDVTTGSFMAPKGCFASTHCALDEAPLDCASTCTLPASACPDFDVKHVVQSQISARHYVITKRGVVVLRDDGQVWVPLARLEEAWSAGTVSGASFLRVATARNGEYERLFLLHNQGFVRVIDVSLNEPVTILPAHPDIPISLGDLDERGAMAFLASDAQTLFFADPYEGRLIRLNGLDHKRQALTFAQDVPGNGFFGASPREDGVVVFRMQFGVLSAMLLSP